MDESTPSIFGLVLGALLLGYVIFSKVVEVRFRRASIPVAGKVLKVFSHSHCTSYFIAYEWDGETRAAEYCGVPLKREFEPGDEVEILIDPRDPPNSEVPETAHNAPGRGVGGGNCERVGTPIFGIWDGVYLAASVALILYSFQ